jgi:3-hydroxyisobutyrate dehydrogenase
MAARAVRQYSAPANNTVGFIGLGNMGKGMAENLVTKGHPVLAYDVAAEAVSDIVGKGAEGASGPAQVAAGSERVVTMLPNNAIVETVYKEVLDNARSGSLLIDCSTVDPALSKQLWQEAQAKGCQFVDAPVSGGINAASAGTLTFMVGAESEETFAAAEILLKNMGAKITHCGGVGTGGAVKICNNLLLAISMIGTSEAMNLGIKLGLDPKLLASIMGSATGRCWSVDTYNPCPGVLDNVPSSNDYRGGFGTALMTKDLGLAQDAATRTKAATPLGSVAHQMYRVMCNAGYAEKDFSSAFQFLREKDD